MEVPSSVLQKLKCENCENYLSRGPVLMLDDGESRCGRCLEPEEGAKRNKHYEELAQLMAFPCRYKENGCEAKIPFEDNKVHEDACAYRMLVCPIAESGKCDWSGVRGSLFDHCKQKHPSNVIGNPAKFKHDITKSSLGNYLLFAFQMLFLVQTKVCNVSRKIYHSVRLLDDPRVVSKYSYDLDITNGTGKLTKHGKVAPQGCLAIQEDTSVAMDINGLLTVLGGWKDTIFTLTVRSEDGKTVHTSPVLPTTSGEVTKAEILMECRKCKCQTKPIHYNKERMSSGWWCQDCAPAREPCKYSTKGCTYKDIRYKTIKHSMYYCQYISQCNICKKNLCGVTLDVHYTQIHGNISRQAGEIWTATLSNSIQWCIINSEFGKAICLYVLNDSSFILQVRSPLSTDQLYMYRCVLKIDPAINNSIVALYNASTIYEAYEDWYVFIAGEHLRPHIVNNRIRLSIEFLKTEKLDQLCL